jgi:carbon storage regulator
MILLVLTRKVGEGIAIGDDIKIVVMQIKGKQVRLGIKASPQTVVHREEIFQKIQEENQKAGTATPDLLTQAADTLREANADFSVGNTPVKRFRRQERG